MCAPGFMSRITATVLLVAPAVLAAQQESPLFAFRGSGGTYAVGLRVVEQYDYSRIFMPVLDNLGKPYKQRARPLQTLIWYPGIQAGSRIRSVVGPRCGSGRGAFSDCYLRP